MGKHIRLHEQEIRDSRTPEERQRDIEYSQRYFNDPKNRERKNNDDLQRAKDKTEFGQQQLQFGLKQAMKRFGLTSSASGPPLLGRLKVQQKKKEDEKSDQGENDSNRGGSTH
ncbi:MAG: hypothetical protein WBF33_29700 [Candidatus Nitrosopolaris sp.]